MILSLYIMTICLCVYSAMIGCDMEKGSLIVLMVGTAFFWIANISYDNTINKLKNEIEELKKKIDHVKE